MLVTFHSKASSSITMFGVAAAASASGFARPLPQYFGVMRASALKALLAIGKISLTIEALRFGRD